MVQSSDSTELAQPCTWATECPAVKVEHCPLDAGSIREGTDSGTASLVSVS